MNFNKLEKTIIPFMSGLNAAKVFTVLVLLIVLTYIVRKYVYKHSLTFRRGPTAVVFYLIIASLMCTVLYVFFYWYIAFLLSVAIALAFMSAVSHEVHEGNTDERVGVWGLNSDIRTVRAELFNDMSIEEQLEYTKNVKEYNFQPILFVLAVIAIPLVIVTVFHFADIGFLWFPVSLNNI